MTAPQALSRLVRAVRLGLAALILAGLLVVAVVVVPVAVLWTWLLLTVAPSPRASSKAARFVRSFMSGYLDARLAAAAQRADVPWPAREDVPR